MASALVWTTLPYTTCWICSGETLACASAPFADSTASSVALTSLRAPPYVPNGVRLPDRK